MPAFFPKRGARRREFEAAGRGSAKERRRGSVKLAKLLLTLLSLSLAQDGAAQEATPESRRGVRSPGNAEWAATPDQARTRAAAEGKLVFVEFGSPQCGNCTRMDALLYPAFDFEALLISMVPAKVSLESPVGRELAQRYGIREAPAILITTPEGRRVFLMEGFQNAPSFYREVHKELDAYREFAREIEAQDIPRLSPERALQTGAALYRRVDSAAALPRLQRAAEAPKAPAAVRDDARELLAAVQLDLGQIEAARRTTARLIATTRDRDRRERAELFRAQLPLAENKPAEALALFKRFEKDHPRSIHLPRVRELVQRLEERLGRP
jgi:tetratricopeptide (TPR) repeat protein